MPNDKDTEIKKALEAATPGPWAPCTWDPMERPHFFAVDKQPGTHCNGKADLPLTAADAFLIAMSKDWLRYLIQQNEQQKAEIERLKAVNDRFVDSAEKAIQQSREENERLRYEVEVQRRAAELGAKGMVDIEEELRRERESSERLTTSRDFYKADRDWIKGELEKVKDEQGLQRYCGTYNKPPHEYDE